MQRHYLMIGGTVIGAALAGWLVLFPPAPLFERLPRPTSTREQEAALGLQAAPEVATRFSGLSRDSRIVLELQQSGQDMVDRGTFDGRVDAFDFHVLDDAHSFFALTLIGGQVFLTLGMMETLADPDQIAAIVAHQIGHSLARHPAELLARTRIFGGPTGAHVLARYNPENEKNRNGRRVRNAVEHMIDIQHSESEEIEADSIAAELLGAAGYDPAILQITLRRILAMETSRTDAFRVAHPLTEQRLSSLDRIQARVHRDPARARDRRSEALRIPPFFQE